MIHPQDASFVASLQNERLINQSAPVRSRPRDKLLHSIIERIGDIKNAGRIDREVMKVRDPTRQRAMHTPIGLQHALHIVLGNTVRTV